MAAETKVVIADDHVVVRKGLRMLLDHEAELILAQSPTTAVVILTMQNDPAFAREALHAGALGFVLEDAADDELLQQKTRRASRVELVRYVLEHDLVGR